MKIFEYFNGKAVVPCQCCNDHWCCRLRKLFSCIRPLFHLRFSIRSLFPLLSFPFVRFSKALFSKFKSAYDMFWSFCVANLENFPTQNDNNHLHMNYMCSLYFVLVWYIVIYENIATKSAMKHKILLHVFISAYSIYSRTFEWQKRMEKRKLYKILIWIQPKIESLHNAKWKNVQPDLNLKNHRPTAIVAFERHLHWWNNVRFC